MNWLRRIGLISALSALALVLSASSVFAATISEVVDDVSTTGFYLDDGVSISESDATEIVSAARNNGSRFFLVVLNDTPVGGNTAFAEAVFDDLNVDAGTILVLSPEDVGWVSDNEGFTEDDLEAAYEFAADEGGSDAEFAANFVIGLIGEGEVAPQPTSAGSSNDGGGSGLIWLLVIVVVGGLLLFWLMRRGNKQSVNAAAEQMAKARRAVQKQVDAIANDILDMEDEVRTANNAEVDKLYNQAGETYRTVTERLQQADTPEELVDLSNDLDEAIWELDCAEALLDGKPKPPKPQRKRLEPELSADDRVTAPAPRGDYQRRPGRRSSYMGPGVMEILVGVAGQVLVGGGRGRSVGLGGMFGRGTTQRTTTTSSSTSSNPSRSTRRRRGGGRVRGGGKRRRSRKKSR